MVDCDGELAAVDTELPLPVAPESDSSVGRSNVEGRQADRNNRPNREPRPWRVS